METTEKVPDSTTDSQVNTQEIPETQTQNSSEVNPQPTSEVEQVANEAEDSKEEGDEIAEEMISEGVKVNGNTVTIDAEPYVSEMFSKNPGEISKFFNMTSKELKKEHNKMNRKGFAMDNKYANLFLLQSIRDECGVLVMGCLASWLLTRLGFSIYWTLFVMFATLMAYVTYNNRKKHLYFNKERKAFNQKTKLNPDNPETLNWLNYIIQKAWPTVEPFISNIVLDSVNGILDSIEIGFDSIQITKFSLGTEGPQLKEMCPIVDSDPNVIKFTCIAQYEPLDTNKISKYEIESGEKRASDIVLSIKPTSLVPAAIPTQVTDVLFIGKILFVITTMESFPYVKKVEFTFLEQPTVKWTLKPLKSGIDIMKFGLDSGIDLIVKKIIAMIALEPTRIILDVEDILNSMTLDQPIGLLKLNFYEGKDLKNTSKMGTDDPYAKFSVNGNTLCKTKAINNDLNPAWNHTEYVIVSGLIYSDPKNNSDLAIIEAMTDNSIKKDNVMGRAEDFRLREYIVLCEIMRKEKLEKEREAAFIENLAKQGIVNESQIKRLRKAENKKRRKELLLREKNKDFAQKLISSLEVSAEEYINGLTEQERKEYISQWGNPLVESDSIIPLYGIGKNNKIDKGKPAGSIRMGINYIPLNQFNEAMESNNTPVFSETGIARIWIYKIQKLEKTPNPYCIADIDGQEIIRTPVRKYNNNPGYNSFKDVFIKNFSSAKLNIVVKNKETGSDSVLGEFSWDVYEIYERIREDPSANWFKLSKCKFEEAVINIGIEWKPMVMNMSTNLQKPIGVCRLHVKGARNLKNHEGIGSTDPYVKINLSGKEIGVSDIVSDDLNPEFREVYYLMIRSKNDRLGFDLFDYDEMKNDRRLGKVEMNVTDICREIKVNGEESIESKLWEEMEHLSDEVRRPVRKMTKEGNIAVTVPLFENQRDKKLSQGSFEFDLSYHSIVDFGSGDEDKEDKEEKKQEEDKAEDVLATSVTENPFLEKLQATDLVSGILYVKIFSVSKLKENHFFYVETYFEDEPSKVLLTTKKTSKSCQESNIGEVAEGFVRDYKNTKLIIAINEKNGNNIKRLATFTAPIEKLLIGKVDLNTPYVHACDDGTTMVKLGVEYDPLNMHLERSELSPQMGTLNVHIDKGTELAAKDSNGSSDPYVKVMFRGEEVYKTSTIKKTLEPVWNEKFNLDIADRLTNKLTFQVYDWNKIGKADFIGQTDIPLYEIYDGEMIAINKRELYNYNNKNEKVICGYIFLNIEFTRNIHNKRMRNRIGNNNAAMKLAGGVVGGVGNVAGGVVGGVGTVAGGVASGVGTVAGGVASGVGSIVGGVTRGIKKTTGKSNKKAGGSSLKIKVISAEGLKAVDNSGTSDPYVKVQHQKKTLYKTKSIKKTLNPTWNEECSIPFDKETSDPILSFVIKDSNIIGKSVDIGLVEFNIVEILGDQTSINQTFDVQNGPGKLTLQIEYVEDAATAAAAATNSPAPESA